MPRLPVRVCIRTRPTGNFAQDEMEIDTENQTIMVNQDTAGSEDYINNQQKNFRFQFHQVIIF